MDEIFLYHYFEQRYGPFASLTARPMEEARAILLAQKAAGHTINPDMEGFLKKRYNAEQALFDMFTARGGRPQRQVPVYMTLGKHKQWASAYEEPAVIKIPLAAVDPLAVSFTYGDSFAVMNPALFGTEEYWNQIYFADEMLAVIKRNGWPPYVDYDFKRGIYPADNPINHCLKYVEAHVWDDALLRRYRAKWDGMCSDE